MHEKSVTNDFASLHCALQCVLFYLTSRILEDFIAVLLALFPLLGENPHDRPSSLSDTLTNFDGRRQSIVKLITLKSVVGKMYLFGYLLALIGVIMKIK